MIPPQRKIWRFRYSQSIFSWLLFEAHKPHRIFFFFCLLWEESRFLILNHENCEYTVGEFKIHFVPISVFKFASHNIDIPLITKYSSYPRCHVCHHLCCSKVDTYIAAVTWIIKKMEFTTAHHTVIVIRNNCHFQNLHKQFVFVCYCNGPQLLYQRGPVNA